MRRNEAMHDASLPAVVPPRGSCDEPLPDFGPLSGTLDACVRRCVALRGLDELDAASVREVEPLGSDDDELHAFDDDLDEPREVAWAACFSTTAGEQTRLWRVEGRMSPSGARYATTLRDETPRACAPGGQPDAQDEESSSNSFSTVLGVATLTLLGSLAATILEIF